MVLYSSPSFLTLARSSNSLRTYCVCCQGNHFERDMSKRQNKKAHVAEGEPDVENITKVEYIYEDTRATSGVKPDYKWGEIYRMIANQNVPDAGFEELTIYANIEKYALMKVATRPELFPCSEVIGWILPRAYVTTMMLENTTK